MATPYYEISPIQYVLSENKIRMHLYLHQIVQGQPMNNQEVMVSSDHPNRFGTIAVNDWTIIDGPNPSAANIIARAKGQHILADQANPSGWYMSLNIEFEDSRFQGSTLEVMGMFKSAGEWAIVGGTGEFSMARGTIKYSIIQGTPNVFSVRDLDIEAFYTPNTTSTVQAVVTVANATGSA